MINTGFQPPGAFITHLMKCGFKRYGPVEFVGDFEVHNLDLTSLKLDVGILTPCLIWKPVSGQSLINSEQLAQSLPGLISVTSSRRKKCFVLIVGGKLIRIEKQIVEDLGLLGVAVVDRVSIEAAYATNDVAAKRKVISAALVNFLGRESLSPYVSGRPAIGGRFFGRSSLVKRILPSAGNFTIVGNRRIGKTSLLKEIQGQVRRQHAHTAEIYGATCNSASEVAYKLLQGLGLIREAEHLLNYPRKVGALPAYIHTLSEVKDQSIAIFIDELDHILEFDSKRDYELLHLLRETCEGNQHCRVFLAGFRKVMEVAQSVTAPLFNFTTLIELPLFSKTETYEMVTTPMEHLGIPVSNTDLPAAVYRETGGHPELIQIHCAEIVRFVEVYERVPSESDLLTGVFNTAEYKQKVLRTFLANTNPYEELLCYLLMSDAEQSGRTANYEFDPGDVHRVLEPVGVSLEVREIVGILTNLKASGIVSLVLGEREKYRFSAPRIINYGMGLKLEFCIEKALDNVRDQLHGALEARDYAPRGQTPADGPAQTENTPHKTPVEESKLRMIDRARTKPHATDSTNRIKHIYFVPAGGAIVTDPEGISTLGGTIDPRSVEDLNSRCLDMVDRWTNHRSFEQKLGGIGKQLTDALMLGMPELLKHLHDHSDYRQLIIATDGPGLRIPFELLPFEKTHLASLVSISRRLTNYHLPSSVQFSFQELMNSLIESGETLRLLQVASAGQETLTQLEQEVEAVRSHVEKGCRRLGLKFEAMMIPSAEATSERVESEFIRGGPFHMFHFTGHGRHFSEDPDASGIVLQTNNGEPNVISCKRLSQWLEGTKLWLAYIGACESSAASGSGTGLSQKYVGTMESIVAAGVPNVVGFRWLVSDQSAFHLADEFYRQLFEVQSEKNLSLAMLEARRAVKRRADFFDAWASSMLITQYS